MLENRGLLSDHVSKTSQMWVLSHKNRNTYRYKWNQGWSTIPWLAPKQRWSPNSTSQIRHYCKTSTQATKNCWIRPVSLERKRGNLGDILTDRTSGNAKSYGTRNRPPKRMKIRKLVILHFPFLSDFLCQKSNLTFSIVLDKSTKTIDCSKRGANTCQTRAWVAILWVTPKTLWMTGTIKVMGCLLCKGED